MAKLLITQADLDEELRAAGESAVIVFYTGMWCAPCDKVRPSVDALLSKYPTINMVMFVGNNSWKIPPTEADKEPCDPTFKVFVRGQEVEEDTLTGARADTIEILFKKYA